MSIPDAVSAVRPSPIVRWRTGLSVVVVVLAVACTSDPPTPTADRLSSSTPSAQQSTSASTGLATSTMDGDLGAARRSASLVVEIHNYAVGLQRSTIPKEMVAPALARVAASLDEEIGALRTDDPPGEDLRGALQRYVDPVHMLSAFATGADTSYPPNIADALTAADAAWREAVGVIEKQSGVAIVATLPTLLMPVAQTAITPPGSGS